ncbi:MAG TPA: GNAT family N-acetyltransferase [Streptosporangiaceae bacterium]|nr:GNAT family N-acetyltransferase [Streptosporangiaceae bacterium]
MRQAPQWGQETLEVRRTFNAAEEALQTRDTAPYSLAALAQQISEGTVTLQVRRATVEDLAVILDMIDEAKAWLRTKGTDQWSKDWPDKDGRRRSDRVEHSLKEETTWLVRLVVQGREIPVATVTIEKKANPDVWPGQEKTGGSAAYLSRLVTARGFAGLQIGAALIDWACAYAEREYHAKSIRIDVWTNNCALHKYYENLDFEARGKCPNEDYPSRALFERATSIKKGLGPSLVELRDTSSGIRPI